MDKTPNLQLSLMANKQGQRATYHDNALKDIDTLVMLSVIDRDHSSPPVSALDGDRYLVKTPGSGDPAWVTNNIVVYIDGGWRPYPPRLGWTCYFQHDGALLAWHGSSWQPALDVMAGGSALQNLALLGIGTTADGTNPLSAKLNNALWTAKTVAEGGDGNLRYKMSKESAAKTLSLLFQDNYSGRAEVGLSGDDDLHFKVSPDGSSWLDALTIDRTSGKLTIGQGFADQAATRVKVYAAPFDALACNGIQANGSADVSQQNGTTQLTLVSDTETYTIDMWLTAYKNSGAVVKARQLVAASFPAALSGYGNAVELKATTALSSLANGDYAKHIHVIEGYRIARMGWGASGAQSLSYAFQYYNPGSTATIMVKLSNSGRSRCYYDEKSVAAGWNFVTGTLAGDTTGTWDATTGIGLRIEVFSAGKAASPATAGSWGSTNTTASSGMTQNILSTNNFAAVVTGLIVLPGLELPSSSRAPLIMRPFDQETSLCKRYWEKTYDYVDAVGTNTWNSARYGVATSTTDISAPLTFQVSKRSAPTVTLYSKNGTSGKWSTNGSVDTASASAFAVGSNGFLEVSSSALTATNSYGGHFVADARL